METVSPFGFAVDGPAGSGKGSVCAGIAERYGYTHRDTGADYRGLASACHAGGIDVYDEKAVVAITVEFLRGWDVSTPGRFFFGSEDYTDRIRSPENSAGASTVSAYPGVRQLIVAAQRAIAVKGHCVIEGRDICSVVYPEALLKIYLDADPEVRRDRRQEEGAEAIARRDRQDSTRLSSPLTQAPDALRVDTTVPSVEEIVDHLCQLYEMRVATYTAP